MKLIDIYKGDGGHFDKTYIHSQSWKKASPLKRYLLPQQGSRIVFKNATFFWANMLNHRACVPTPNMDCSNSRMLLLMEEILHHLRCIKPCKEWDIYHINWCRISSINSILRNLLVDWQHTTWQLMIGQRWADRFISTSVAEQQQPWCDSCSVATIVTYRSVWGLSFSYDAAEGPRFGATARFDHHLLGADFGEEKDPGSLQVFFLK